MSAGSGHRLRVGLELTCFELDRGGTARAARNLWAALEVQGAVDVEPLRHSGAPLGGRFARGLARELIYFPVGLSHLASAKDIDVLHCPSHLMPARVPCPLVVTLNDVRAWRRPETVSRGNSLQHRLVVERVLQKAAAVMTPSEFTRNEVLELLDLEPSRVVVAPYGVQGRFCAGPRPEELLDELSIQPPYVLVVGTAPHKNLAAAIAAVEQVARIGAPHSLVIAGPPEDDPNLAKMIAASDIAPRIHPVGYVDDETLVSLYRGADCLLHPSRYEGFGFPSLEAMACGVPVIAGRGTAIEEVVGNAAALVDPDDFEGFGLALEQVISSLPTRLEYSGRGLVRAAQFSWRRCAEITTQVYEQVLQEAAEDLGQAA